MIWSSQTIRHYVDKFGLISPFQNHAVRENENGVQIPSYGISSCGYDVTGSGIWKLAKVHTYDFNAPKNLVDLIGDYEANHIRDITEANKEHWFETIESNEIVIPPGGFVLTSTKEYFKIPKHACASLYGKSTLARSGIIVPFTICEPGWEGNLVIEIHNQMPFPVRIYADMGLGQMVFFDVDDETDIPYDHTRKYQGQTGVTLAK